MTAITAIEIAELDLGRAARTAFRRRVRLGIPRYRRDHLSTLIPVSPYWERYPECYETSQAIIKVLKSALRVTVRAQRQGRWFYDPNRHMALLTAIGAELLIMRSLAVRELASRDAG